MRLKRAATELRSDPTNLALYDDAGVACDRLHHDKEAIVWMKRKRAQLDRLGFNDKSKEHWYRYHANLGTFLAHDWLSGGANRKNLVPMRQAVVHIKRAIAINPKAHFGREKYQLKVMEWIIKPPAVKAVMGNYSLPTFLALREEASITTTSGNLAKYGYADAITGLSGLIALGNAWESIDVFNALQTALMADGNHHMAYMAAFRLEELEKAGRRSLLPNAPYPVFNPAEDQLTSSENLASGASSEGMVAFWRRFYKLRREEAEGYQTRRTAYMMERLKAGRHPDTDANFWNEWRDTPPPGPEIMNTIWFRNPWLASALQLFSVAALSCLMVFFMRRRYKRVRRAVV